MQNAINLIYCNIVFIANTSIQLCMNLPALFSHYDEFHCMQYAVNFIFNIKIQIHAYQLFTQFSTLYIYIYIEYIVNKYKPLYEFFDFKCQFVIVVVG